MKSINWRFVLGYTAHLTVMMMIGGGLLLRDLMIGGVSFSSAFSQALVVVFVALIATVLFMARCKWLWS